MTGHRIAAALLGAGGAHGAASPAFADDPVNGRIAYTTFESSADPAAGDIWTMNADGGGNRRQAVFDPTYDAQSDWSPDGTKIVFRSRRNNRYQVAIIDFSVGAPGGDARASSTSRPRRMARSPAMPSWFPNGQGILYRRTNGARRDDEVRRVRDGPGRFQPAARSRSCPRTSSIRAYSPDMTEDPVLDHQRAGRRRRPQHPGDGRRDGHREDAVRLQRRRAMTPGPAWSPDGSEDRVREQPRRRHGSCS